MVLRMKWSKNSFSLRKFLANGRLRQNSLAIANAMAWCTQLRNSTLETVFRPLPIKLGILVPVCFGARLDCLNSSTQKLTYFRASFFPFCPFCWPPLFLPLSPHHFRPFLPSKSALFCRAKGTAQSLERGSLRMDFSTKFGKEIPSRNLHKKKVRKGIEAGGFQTRKFSEFCKISSNFEWVVS